MDYTKVPRPLIYRDRSEVSDFLDGSFGSIGLNKDFYDNLLERPFIDRVDDAAAVVLDIFNNAYYIATLIGMTLLPELDLKKYLEISHNGHDKSIEWVNHVSPATMALVWNLLQCFKNDSASKRIIKKISAFYKDWDLLGSPEGKEEFHSLLRNYKYEPPSTEERKDFLAPCAIDAKTVADAGEFLHNHNSDWGRLTDNFKDSRINELLSVCKNEDERSLLATTLHHEKEIHSHHVADIITTQKEVVLKPMRKEMAESHEAQEWETVMARKEENEKQEEKDESLKKECTNIDADADNLNEEENTTSKYPLKLRIELLNHLLAQAGFPSAVIKENRLASNVVKLYHIILGEGANRLLKENIGKVVYKQKPDGLDEKVKEVNKLLIKINEKWSIKL